MMRRTVFYLPDPATPRWRVPIAEIGAELRILPHDIDPRWSGGVPAVLTSLAAQPLDGTSLPDGIGPHAVLGDLVRLTRHDGRIFELDEQTHVGWRQHGLDHDRDLTFKLMSREPCDGDMDSLYFFHGPRAFPVVHLAKARGQQALLEGEGDAWHRVDVESWEDEARRLRRLYEGLAAGLPR